MRTGTPTPPLEPGVPVAVSGSPVRSAGFGRVQRCCERLGGCVGAADSQVVVRPVGRGGGGCWASHGCSEQTLPASPGLTAESRPQDAHPASRSIPVSPCPGWDVAWVLLAAWGVTGRCLGVFSPSPQGVAASWSPCCCSLGAPSPPPSRSLGDAATPCRGRSIPGDGGGTHRLCAGKEGMPPNPR